MKTKIENEKIDTAMIRCLAVRGIDERSIHGEWERSRAQNCQDLIRLCLVWLRQSPVRVDRQWVDVDENGLLEFPDSAILTAVRVHYRGGLGQFITDTKGRIFAR